MPKMPIRVSYIFGLHHFGRIKTVPRSAALRVDNTIQNGMNNMHTRRLKFPRKRLGQATQRELGRGKGCRS